jgi:hypothetical protein
MFLFLKIFSITEILFREIVQNNRPNCISFFKPSLIIPPFYALTLCNHSLTSISHCDISMQEDDMGFSNQCTTCGEVKWWYQFGKRKKGPFNLQSSCNACVAQRSLRWAKENPEKVRDAYRRWKEKNPERAKKIRQKHYQKDKFVIKAALKLKISIPEARRRLSLNRARIST